MRIAQMLGRLVCPALRTQHIDATLARRCSCCFRAAQGRRTLGIVHGTKEDTTRFTRILAPLRTHVRTAPGEGRPGSDGTGRIYTLRTWEALHAREGGPSHPAIKPASFLSRSC